MTEEIKLDLMKKFKELNVAEYTTKYGDYYGLMFAGAEIATKELEAQIEKMKCCFNCKHSRTEYEHCRTDKHEKWEIKEK